MCGDGDLTCLPGIVFSWALYFSSMLATQYAVAGEKVYFDIPSQRAAVSLTAFANQAGLTLIVPYDIVSEKKTNRLVGEYQVEEAIKILLDRTGLNAIVGKDNQLKITVNQISGEQDNMKNEPVKAVGLLAFMTSLLAASPASAQEPASRSSVLEEIVVTAQKREQSLQDVGISVTAFSGEQLAGLGLNNSNELVYFTPGLTLQNVGGEGNITSLSLRGIGQGDFNDHQESPVAIYNDEVYNAYMGATNTVLFDLERVEILRGPQGTLFGRNATGGLIHYISQKPTEEVEGYGDLSIAEHSHVRFEGAVGGGITDTVFARVSGFVNKHDEYVDNLAGPDGNEADTWAIRGQLDFQPTDKLSVLLKAEYYETDISHWHYETVPAFTDPTDGFAKRVPANQNMWAGIFGSSCNGCDAFGFNEAADGDPETVNMDAVEHAVAARGESPGGLKRDGILGSVTINWEWDNGMTFTSITGYSEHNKFFNQDSDGNPFPLVTFGTDTNAQQFSQELRLAGETDKMRWVTGFYYFEYDSDIVLDVGFFAPSAFFTDQEVFTKNWSIFGQVEYDFAPDWTVIAGLRYLDEEKEMDASGSIAGFIAGLAIPRLAGSFNTELSPYAKVEEDDIAGKFQLNWRINDNTLLYAGVSRGVKAGGFNGVFGLPGAFWNIPYKREKPITYEAGFKTTLLDGRARWNTSFYYYDYQAFQAFAYLALSQQVFNTQAEVYGFDTGLRVTPVDGLDLMLGLNVMDAEAENVGNSGGYVANRDLPNSPTVQLNGVARYSWPAWNGGTMAVQGDFNHQSKNHFQIFNDPVGTISGYVVGNARLSYTSSGERWSAAIFVKNIGDKEYVTSIANNSSFGLMQYFYARPRWVGGQIIYHWN